MSVCVTRVHGRVRREAVGPDGVGGGSEAQLALRYSIMCEQKAFGLKTTCCESFDSVVECGNYNDTVLLQSVVLFRSSFAQCSFVFHCFYLLPVLALTQNVFAYSTRLHNLLHFECLHLGKGSFRTYNFYQARQNILFSSCVSREVEILNIPCKKSGDGRYIVLNPY